MLASKSSGPSHRGHVAASGHGFEPSDRGAQAGCRPARKFETALHKSRTSGGVTLPIDSVSRSFGQSQHTWNVRKRWWTSVPSGPIEAHIRSRLRLTVVPHLCTEAISPRAVPETGGGFIPQRHSKPSKWSLAMVGNDWGATLRGAVVHLGPRLLPEWCRHTSMAYRAHVAPQDPPAGLQHVRNGFLTPSREPR